MADNTLENKHNWYVFRVFGNRALSCEQKLKAIGFETYVPVLTRWKEGENGLEYFPADQLAYKSGTKVRVTAGLLKGSVGEIKRIKGNRRFVVEIQGICAIATSYIPSEFLQKL